MRVSSVVSGLVVICSFLVLVAVNCTGEMSARDLDNSNENPNVEDPLTGCDPDGMEPCANTFIICTADDASGKHCEGPALTGELSGWDCEPNGDALVCLGDFMPEDSGDWDCVEIASGEVECTMTFFGDEGSEGRWVCDEDEFTVCVFESIGDDDSESDDEEETGDEDDEPEEPGFPDDGGAECPPGVEVPTAEVCDDGIDNNCNGIVDADCVDGPEVPDDCLCIPGAWRYCDEPLECAWGMQVCEDDGLSWGACTETSIPLECQHLESFYGYRAEGCCITSGYCCQDFWDIDGDGDRLESLGNCIDIMCVPNQ